MKEVCFINGSPRGINSTSKGLIDKVIEMLDTQKTQSHELSVVEWRRKNTKEEDFELMSTMHAIVFVFPLYVDAIPSSLLEFMYAFDEYLTKHPCPQEHKAPKVYSIINNGFIEGKQNINALQIMAHYSARIGYNWRFGIGIGAGEFMRETMEVIPLKSKLKQGVYNAFTVLTTDLEVQEVTGQNNIMTNPSMPKFIFTAAASRHWIKEAKMSKKTLSKRVWTEA
jgi:multimeric flavodoxin WrbA